MQIIRARDMGFCFGVRRAVEMMEREAEGGRPVASLGSVVHNPLVVERLRERGLDVVATLEEVGDRRLAITAHGVGPIVIEEAGARGYEIVDTTCPIVTRAQQWAKKLIDEGFAVVVYGDPEHKETRGILGWARGKAHVLRTADEIDTLPANLPSRIGVLVQTTHTEANFAAFVNRLLTTRMEKISELRVINTLCNATTGQQAAARELAHQVELVIVVGGRESANTRHLREVCEEEGTRAFHIESAEELDTAWFAGVERVGVTAGASTPDYSVEEVVARLEEIGRVQLGGDGADAMPSPAPMSGESRPSAVAPTAEEIDRIRRWRAATPDEHGEEMARLFKLADQAGPYPPKGDMFPGFKALMRRDESAP